MRVRKAVAPVDRFRPAERVTVDLAVVRASAAAAAAATDAVVNIDDALRLLQYAQLLYARQYNALRGTSRHYYRTPQTDSVATDADRKRRYDKRKRARQRSTMFGQRRPGQSHCDLFLPRDDMLARYMLYSCVSVCLSQVGVLLKLLNVGSCKQRRNTIAQGLYFSDTKGLGKTQTGSAGWQG